MFLPWGSFTAAWTMWTAARVLVTREREELTAPDLGPFMRAVDLSLGSWFTVRFATPMLLEALYGCVVLGGLLWGVSAAPETTVAAFAMLLGGYVAHLGRSSTTHPSRSCEVRLHPGGVTVLDDVTMTFPRSGVVALRATNGAGKSTLIELVSDYLKPQKGRVEICGHPRTPQDFRPDAEYQLAPERR